MESSRENHANKSSLFLWLNVRWRHWKCATHSLRLQPSIVCMPQLQPWCLAALVSGTQISHDNDRASWSSVCHSHIEWGCNSQCDWQGRSARGLLQFEEYRIEWSCLNKKKQPFTTLLSAYAIIYRQFTIRNNSQIRNWIKQRYFRHPVIKICPGNPDQLVSRTYPDEITVRIGYI